MSSQYGEALRVSLFGQSHAPAVGVTIDGLPAGLPVDLEALGAFLRRRAPGRHAYSTPRKESDIPEILCGLVDGKTCGAPLTAIIRSENTRSGDYAELRDVPRPGHADFAAQMKYGGFQDVAGGGHFSARLTAPLCIAGGICLQLLGRFGVSVAAHIASVGPVDDDRFDPLEPRLPADADPDFPVLRPAAGEAMRAEIDAARAAGDSVGGSVECAVTGLPAGLGGPLFGGLEGRLSLALFGIPAVKGVEFGSGFDAARLRGSENNDPFCIENGAVRTETNRHGGILGGISTGMPLLFRAAFKPTPSIARPQRSVSLSRMEERELCVRGRHDPCIVPRAVPCVEAAAALALADALLLRQSDHLFWEE